jgi:hypothetical protein
LLQAGKQIHTVYFSYSYHSTGRRKQQKKDGGKVGNRTLSKGRELAIHINFKNTHCRRGRRMKKLVCKREEEKRRCIGTMNETEKIMRVVCTANVYSAGKHVGRQRSDHVPMNYSVGGRSRSEL